MVALSFMLGATTSSLPFIQELKQEIVLFELEDTPDQHLALSPEDVASRSSQYIQLRNLGVHIKVGLSRWLKSYCIEGHISTSPHCLSMFSLIFIAGCLADAICSCQRGNITNDLRQEGRRHRMSAA